MTDGVLGAQGNEPIGLPVNNHGGLIQVRIVAQGVTPLMMNAMGKDKLMGLWDGPGSGKKGRAAARPKPRDWSESVLHRLPDGRPHLPARCLMSCLIGAGQFIRLDGKRQITTEKKTILPGMLTLLDTEILLAMHDGTTPARWEVDIQQGRNPNGGEAVCIIRPRFDEWQFVFHIEVDQEQMPLQLARSLVDIAGRRVGLLEYRPARKGTFGRFNVVQWEVQRLTEAA